MFIKLSYYFIQINEFLAKGLCLFINLSMSLTNKTRLKRSKQKTENERFIRYGVLNVIYK